jgi:hypothetical protein
LDLAARQWGLAGVPFDTYELHDLAHPAFPGGRYKLLIFVNCAYVAMSAAVGVRRWQGDGRTLLWTYAAACLDDAHFDPALGEELIGMRLGCRRRREPIRIGIPGETRARSGSSGSSPPAPNTPFAELVRGSASLDFGTSAAVGPVFFADDPRAVVLGRIRDGGQAAFAARDHGTWRSVYLSMLNFGPALLRNLARFAGAHVWIESNDVLYANRSMLCLHTASAGEKVIRLPRPASVTDLWSGETSAGPVAELRFASPAYRTRVWRYA